MQMILLRIQFECIEFILNLTVDVLILTVAFSAFLEGKTTKQTAKEMGYSTSWVSGKKRLGLEMLDKILADSDVQ